MKFADPNFLFALSLVCLPILIHILQFKRYKTVYFSQVDFLKILYDESKKKQNLKQLVILACRILIVAFIVLAFAQPYIPLGSSSAPNSENSIGIYIDNSFSMNGISGNGTLLEEAKIKSIELANSFLPGTHFMLLTNDATSQQRLSLTKEELISEIGKIKSSAANMPLSKVVAILTKQLESNHPKLDKNIYLLSDFQRNVTDLNQVEVDDKTQIYLIPMAQPEVNNLVIDTCWLHSPGRLQGQLEVLKARITNRSTKSFNNIPLRFLLNDSLRSMQTINLKAGETIEAEISYQNRKQGNHYCKLELDDYPISYDNSYYFSYRVDPHVSTLLISPENDPANQWIEKLFYQDEQVRLQKMSDNRLQISRFAEYQCIFLVNLPTLSKGLQTALVSFIKDGGSVAVFPGETIDQTSYNELFSQLNALQFDNNVTSPLKIDRLNLQHHLFHDVFTRDYDRVKLPSIQIYFPLKQKVQTVGTTIMTNNNGSAALSEFPFEQGRLYQFTFPLSVNASDFYRHALFVPVIYNIALHSYFPQTIEYPVQNNQIISLKLGQQINQSENLFLKRPGEDNPVQVPNLNDRYTDYRFSTGDMIHEAGFYNLSSAEGVEIPLAFNYSRLESDLSFYSSDELENIAKSSGVNCQIFKRDNGSWLEQNSSNANVIELWKFALLLALLFALTEMLVIRFWK
ncbi:BatA domain-containing protein [Mangrovibacterium sp.]|uniref:BatA domain-containing protein n=1 Tax=Mangrovibacterium sp. TaxID=1961364 RepID=UPI0035667CFC